MQNDGAMAGVGTLHRRGDEGPAVDCKRFTLLPWLLGASRTDSPSREAVLARPRKLGSDLRRSAVKRIFTRHKINSDVCIQLPQPRWSAEIF